MFGGFGVPGTPFYLINGLLEKGVSEITLVKNEANEAGIGVSKLIENGLVRKIITSHLGLNGKVIEMMNKGEVEVAFYPQGILAEKIRAGGAGHMGFVTDIGIDTIISRDKRIIEVNGEKGVFEPSLRADIAFIHACCADRYGNLIYEKSARNFNPIMAMAADIVIAEAEEIIETGELDPDRIHTPGCFVDYVVKIPEISQEYGVLAHHVV